jgi:hypothetical protein
METNKFKNFTPAVTWTECEEMTETAAKIANELESLGAHVCGSVYDFGYVGGEDSVWIAADSTPHFFNYYDGKIDERLELALEKHGYYFEWHDPGTIMAYPL